MDEYDHDKYKSNFNMSMSGGFVRLPFDAIHCMACK